MFKNNRYITRGVQSRIPHDTQRLLWYLIDVLEIPEVDSYQFFTLTIENGKQKILHEQEQPEYSMELRVEVSEPVTEKIYVIDDGENSTMLLAEEY